MKKKKLKLKLKSIPLRYTINVYGLGIHLRKMFQNTVDAVKHVDWMALKGKN